MLKEKLGDKHSSILCRASAMKKKKFYKTERGLETRVTVTNFKIAKSQTKKGTGGPSCKNLMNSNKYFFFKAAR
jgi:hypothetical protein